jgi:hypothetical protein
MYLIVRITKRKILERAVVNVWEMGSEFGGAGRKQQRLLKSVKADSTAEGLKRIGVVLGVGCEESAEVAEGGG